MNNKILAILFVLFAVMLYTEAVVNLTQGDIGNGVCSFLMAASNSLMAYGIMKVGTNPKAIHIGIVKIGNETPDDDEEKLRLREENAQKDEKIEHLEAELKESTAHRMDLEERISQLTTAEG